MKNMKQSDVLIDSKVFWSTFGVRRRIGHKLYMHYEIIRRYIVNYY